jgi:hypothetical protein
MNLQHIHVILQLIPLSEAITFALLGGNTRVPEAKWFRLQYEANSKLGIGISTTST